MLSVGGEKATVTVNMVRGNRVETANTVSLFETFCLELLLVRCHNWRRYGDFSRRLPLDFGGFYARSTGADWTHGGGLPGLSLAFNVMHCMRVPRCLRGAVAKGFCFRLWMVGPGESPCLLGALGCEEL